jgi:hypothetical protein
MGRPEGLRLRPTGLQRASLWRQFAASTIDGALEIGCHVAWRVLDGWTVPCETPPNLTERVRVAFKEVFEPHRPDDPSARLQTPEGANEFFERLPKSLLEPVGRRAEWTTERAVKRLLPGFIFRAAPMILTGGQTPGQVLLGVRVVSLNGRPITARRALVREFGPAALIAPFDLLPLPQAARGAAKLAVVPLRLAVRCLDRDRRPLEDVLAGTRVLRTS